MPRPGRLRKGCEVFIDEASVPHVDHVGVAARELDVTRITLSHERGLAAGLFGALPPAGGGRTRQEAAAKAGAHLTTYELYRQRAGEPTWSPPIAQRLGRSGEPELNVGIAALQALQRAARLSAQRATAQRRAGRPGPEGSLGKLHGKRHRPGCLHRPHQRRRRPRHARRPDSLDRGIVADVLVSVPGQSIAGGTDEMQYDIIGERVLGLPKEPSVDADIPFRHVRSNRRTGSRS